MNYWTWRFKQIREMLVWKNLTQYKEDFISFTCILVIPSIIAALALIITNNVIHHFSAPPSPDLFSFAVIGLLTWVVSALIGIDYIDYREIYGGK